MTLMLPIEKYTYYVERLLLNDPTTEPTESIPTFAPTQIILSSNPNLDPDILQYIVGISVATSMVTTYIVIIVSYYCAHLRVKLKRQYLNNIYPSSHSSSSSSSHGSESFWFADVYNESDV